LDLIGSQPLLFLFLPLSGHHTLLDMIYFLTISPKAMGKTNCGLKSPKL
jgi:hypothetical protein